MNAATINTRVLKDPSWWHWALTVPLLAAHVAGFAYAIEAAIVLCAIMSGYYFVRIGAVKPFPVQLRLAYLAWLTCGILPGFQWMHWIALLGTTAMVTVGYCPLARMLKLLPFNRNEPLTPDLIWRLFFQDPCVGGLVRWAHQSGVTGAGPCSMSPEGMNDSCSGHNHFTHPTGKHHAQAH